LQSAIRKSNNSPESLLNKSQIPNQDLTDVETSIVYPQKRPNTSNFLNKPGVVTASAAFAPQVN